MKTHRLATLALTLVGLVTLAAAPAASAEPDDPPPGARRGAAAVEALGPRLGPLAQEAGLSGADLAAAIRRDPTMSVDSQGHLLSTDPLPADGAAARATWPATPPFATSRTFALHSRPTATRKIFLDFNGHTMTGTRWNRALGRSSITLGAFNTSGSSATFSASEHAAIQSAFLSMREDFSSFEVDVTTQDPGAAALRRSSSSDTAYGVRVVITTTNFADCDCGGAAYPSTFGAIGDSTPAYVLNLGRKAMAETIAHEAGHTLGLIHDGIRRTHSSCRPELGNADPCIYYAGHGDWAPIMGNSMGRRVTQWSRGEYANADNSQNDLAVLDSRLPKVPDHGGTIATAYPLTIGSRIVGEPINWTADVDAWKVSTTTSRTLSVAVENWYGTVVDTNLNARIRLYSSGGTLLASASPSTSTAATLSRSVGPGTYYVFVDGVGHGSPATTGYSSYASIGRYNMSIR